MGWQQNLLEYIGAPTSPGNGAALTLWAQGESMPGWTFNWLASSNDIAGATNWNACGVKIYPNYIAGIGAIGQNLLENAHGYPLIVEGFRNNLGATFQLWDYINKSDWCKGCQDGLYPKPFWQYLNGTGQIEAGVTGGLGASNPIAVDVGNLAHDVRTAWDDFRQFMNVGWLDNLIGLDWIKDAIKNL